MVFAVLFRVVVCISFFSFFHFLFTASIFECVTVFPFYRMTFISYADSARLCQGINSIFWGKVLEALMRKLTLTYEQQLSNEQAEDCCRWCGYDHFSKPIACNLFLGFIFLRSISFFSQFQERDRTASSLLPCLTMAVVVSSKALSFVFNSNAWFFDMITCAF